jgi:hypothetical protein
MKIGEILKSTLSEAFDDLEVDIDDLGVDDGSPIEPVLKPIGGENSATADELTPIQKIILAKIAKGTLTIDSATDKQLVVMDELMDVGLLDAQYEITPEGSTAADMVINKNTQDQIVAQKIAQKNGADKFVKDRRVRDAYKGELDDEVAGDDEGVSARDRVGFDPEFYTGDRS